MAARVRRFRLSLRLRVAIGAFLVLLGGLAAALATAASGEHQLVEESAKSDYLDYARGLAVILREDLRSGDRARVASHVEAAFGAAGGNIRYVAVRDADGTVWACAGALEASPPVEGERVLEVGPHPTSFLHGEGHVFEIAVPVTEGDARLGDIRMGISTARMNEGVIAMLRSSAAPTAVGIALFVLLALYVDAKLRGTLRRFIAATRRMAGGNLERPVHVSTGDDLEALAHNFNLMAARLRTREEELQRNKSTLEAAVRDRTFELRQQKERLDAIVDAVGAGMLLLDPEMRVLWANRAAQDWFGAGRSIVGFTCPWADRGSRPGCSSCPSRAALASGRTQVADAVPVEVDGSRRYFTVISSPLRSADGRSTEILELLLDVTRRKEVEAELLQAAKLASLGEMAGGVAHEIGNPLAVVSAKVKLLLARLRAGRTPENLAQDLEKIERHTERIGRIAGALLTFSRRSPGDRSPVCVEDALRESVSFLDHRLHGTGVAVEVDAPAGLPEVLGSRGQLVQVFVNLAQNAIDAMPAGGALRIAAAERDEGVEIAFHDEGEGMSEAVRRRVFDPFFTTKAPGQGTGLGLSVSHRIVRDHGGALTAERRPGRGSTFRVWLPAARESAVV